MHGSPGSSPTKPHITYEQWWRMVQLRNEVLKFFRAVELNDFWDAEERLSFMAEDAIDVLNTMKRPREKQLGWDHEQAHFRGRKVC